MPHPYSSTIPGLVNAIRQLRSTFPAAVNADTLRKWSIASNNEGPVLVVLRALGLIDDEGKKQADAAKVFLAHDDADFAKKFEALVQHAYSPLFDAWGDKAWQLERDKLIGFFRAADETSARVGLQQALTFQALAGLAGHGPAPAEPKPIGARSPRAALKSRIRGASEKQTTASLPSKEVPPRPPAQPVLTVRVEINLPVSENQEAYDKIFRSIRENLLSEQSTN